MTGWRVLAAGSRQRQPAEEVLVVAATLDAANEAHRMAVGTAGAAFGWHRISFAQLVANFAASLLAERGLLSRLGIEAVVTRLIHGLHQGGDLGRFAGVAGTPGFPRAIASVIAAVRLAALDADAIETVSPDLAALMVAYEKGLASLGFADWPTAIAAAKAFAITGQAGHRLVGLPRRLLDVPLRCEAEFMLIRALVGHAPETLITVPPADERTLGYVRERIDA